MSPSKWPQTEYTSFPATSSAEAFSSPYLQNFSPFENDFKSAVPGNTFLPSGLGDVSFLDTPLTWSTAGDAEMFNTETYNDSPHLAPSQLEDGQKLAVPEKSLWTNSSSPKLKTKKETSHTPAWTTARPEKEPTKRISKRIKQNEAIGNERLKSSQRSASTSDSDGRLGSHSKGRKNHNRIEKQYRNRLNGQFETLLSALPLEQDANGAKATNDQQERRVSKAEVLIMAKEHIKALEDRKATLENQRTSLVRNIKDLKGAWVEMGGQLIP